MEIFRFKSRILKDYSIACEYWKTSRAWGHRAILMYKEYDLAEEKIRYENRTWEYYTYQSNMYKVVDTFYNNSLEGFIYDYKYKNNIDRFSKGEKDEVIKLFDSTITGKEILAMKKAIKNRDFK